MTVERTIRVRCDFVGTYNPEGCPVSERFEDITEAYRAGWVKCAVGHYCPGHNPCHHGDHAWQGDAPQGSAP